VTRCGAQGEPTVPGHDLIVVGASAGGVEALLKVVGGLPPNLPAAVCVVLHLPAQAPSVLPAILSRANGPPAEHAVDGAPIERGRIYVAPPDHHLLVEPGRLRLSRGPRENRQRPAVDVLFRTAAHSYGPRVVGVVLSGALDDGSAGLVAVKQRGGVAVVQDPNDALFPSMPSSALSYVDADYVDVVAGIGPLLRELAGRRADDQGVGAVPDEMDREVEIAAFPPEGTIDMEQPGVPASMGCPECGGTLWEMQNGHLVRYRCRVGHAFSPDSLLADQGDALEAALWSALRNLQEQATLADRLTRRASENGQLRARDRFAEQQRDASSRADVIRSVLRLEHRAPFPVAQATPVADLGSGATTTSSLNELLVDQDGD
jgi:two-component system chemotaxis response regulator CheB